ncbi:hypothetical protein [Sphaerisporangium corydalis]|uniref:DUF1453 domain-containing protein n=1 Tax=Sphaerisporangium corydalis TaxID=1441875 RepID=A0ABV9EGM7_9ACTN|nr:hypothetical protein [Sphaerisporangium corydalis]
MDPLQTAALAIVVTVLIVYRQMRTRRAAGQGLLYFALALIAVGLLSGGLVGTHDVPLSVGFLVVELAFAVGFGAVRARTVRVWRDRAGVAWAKGTVWTLAGWLASLIARIGLYAAGRGLGLDTAPTSVLLFVGVTIGVQALLVARRARDLPAERVSTPSVPA